MSVAKLIEPIGAKNGAVTLPEALNWMQGRTMYGSASAMIAYIAAQRAFPGLPPLRAAQIGFVAPIGEAVELRTEMIRQGSNVTQLRSEILCDSKLALTALFLFGDGREANAHYRAPPIADWSGWPEDGEVLGDGPGPRFHSEQL